MKFRKVLYIVALTINIQKMNKEFNLNDWEPTGDGFKLTVQLNEEITGLPIVQVWEKVLNNTYRVIELDIRASEDSVTISCIEEFQGRIEIR